MDNQQIVIDNYTVYQQNRRLLNANSRRGSGGIIIAVNNSILSNHNVVGVFKNENDGLLGLKVKNVETGFKIGIVANYLSPDNYHYGQDPEGFFHNLSAMWHDLSECDLRIGGGDLNARTKQLEDYIPEIDGNIPDRSNPDNLKNSHGNSFITFLKDNRSIILNGRVTPHLNNFTFVSTRGSSVPDYLYTPIENLGFCTEMKVILMTDVVDMMGIMPPQTLPDHSLLVASFKGSDFENYRSKRFGSNIDSEKAEQPKNNRKKNIKIQQS